jgi:hypothetical protein
MAKKSATRKPKETAEIDDDGFILVTGKNAARRPQQATNKTTTGSKSSTNYTI